MDIIQKCTEISKISKKVRKVWDFESKNPVFGSKSSEKFKKSLEKVWQSSGSLETGFSECSEISEIVFFQTFEKLRKNDVKLELRKSRKTRSDSKVRLKVWNAGP